MRIRPVHVIGGILCYGAGTYVGVIYMRGRKPTTPVVIESVPEEVRQKRFDEISARYDNDIGFSEYLSGIKSFRKRLLQQSSGTILEVAAGTGRNLEYYPEKSDLVLADLSTGMLEVAKKKASAENAKKGRNVRTVPADASKLPFQDSTFDTVVDTFGLCSVEKPEDTIAEIRRVCKPDGRILLLEHGKSNYKYKWLNQYLENRAPEHAKKWGCWWNKDILDLVEKGGLVIQDMKLHHFGTCYELICLPGKL